MNRKKKINSIYKKRMKQMNAKANPSQKPAYVSKAERAKLAAQEDEHNVENTAQDAK